MRFRVVATTCAVLCGVSGAAVVPSLPDAAARPMTDTLWERALAPHAREINQILGHARRLHEAAAAPVSHPEDEELRDRLLADARGMLRYAHRLDSDNPEVLELLAFVTHDAGRIDEAASAYQRYMDAVPADRRDMTACVRFGALQARRDQYQAAIDLLRRCLDAPGDRHTDDARTQRSRAAILLSGIHAHTGHLEHAVAVLLREQPTIMTHEVAVQFALAVAYDKDEQITRAYEVLDKKLQSLAEDPSVYMLTTRLSEQPLVPAVDRHYFFALLYEVRGLLPEARQEWIAYMRSGPDARFRRRAAQHVEIIDRLLHEALTREPKTARPFQLTPTRTIYAPTGPNP